MSHLASFKALLRQEAAGFDMLPPEHFQGATASVRGQLTRRRRRGEFGAGDTCCLLELRRDANGVLRWCDGFAGPQNVWTADGSSGLRRGFRRSAPAPGEFVDQLQFDRLQPNEISQWLDKLDRKLTPLPRGLHRLDANTQWQPAGTLPAKGRLLIFVHGTFSSSQNFLKELQGTPEGTAFLAAARTHYDAVCAFEHSTLSVSPWLNALELSRALEDTKANVDIIAHSRGGLVARWWADCLDRAPGRTRRCIHVGSPLGGTSAAAPGAIRHSMDLFTNVAEALETAASLGSSMFPLLSVVAGMLKIVGSVTGTIAKLPVADAIIAAIPGLNGQSATSNNFELNGLWLSKAAKATSHFAVRSDFQPVSPGWKFWQYFTRLDHAANAVADRFIFRQPNDLVVDSDYMLELAKGPPSTGIPVANVLDLGTNADVWHCNYFRHQPVLQWLRKTLAIPSPP